MNHVSGQAVFLSYAREDSAAARRIAEALRAHGVEVWFDEDELRGGDAWDAKIRKQIKECVLFVPIISANTQARPEGYFRLEWKLADRRTDLIGKSKAFLLPVCIDDTRDAEADVPDSFLAVQWTRLPRGEANAAYCDRVRSLLESGTGAPPVISKLRQDAHATPRFGRQTHHRWLIGTAIPGAAMLALLLWQPWRKSDATLPAVAKSAAVDSPARKLVAQAWELMNRPEAYRAELEIADDLCRRATVLDPDDADAWAAWSHVDCWYLFYTLDLSQARRDAAWTKVTRALKLAPQSFETRLAETNYHVRSAPGASMGSAPEFAQSITERLRELLVERPSDPRAWFAVGILLRNTGHVADAASAFDRMAETPSFAATAMSEKGWMFWLRGEYANSLKACDRSIEVEPFRGNLLLRIYLSLAWTGDLEMAKTTLTRVPPQLVLEDDFAIMSARTYWWRREPAEVRRVLTAIPRDWLTWHNAPKHYFVGEAHRMSRQEEAAKAAWQEALRSVEEQIAKAPQSLTLLVRKARLLALLARAPEADAVMRLAKASGLPNDSPMTTEFSEWAIALTTGTIDDALSSLERDYEKRDPLRVTWAMLRHNPLLDPLRNEPRFQALLARAEADPTRCPHAKPAGAAAKATAAPAEKSIAVLAFENRSSEKDSEYFSDGISDELLNVLGRVPGLKVIGRTSAFAFKGKNATTNEIGRTLGVTHLVEGSVQRSGTRARIEAKLIRADTGEILWGDKFDTELKDIFGAQEDIAQLIAKNLSVTLGARHTKSVDPAAHRLVLEGRQFWKMRNEVGFARADAAFTKALQIDPQFAEAHADLAGVCVIRANFRQTEGFTDTAGDIIRGRNEARRALELDGSLAEAYAALAFALMLDGNFTESEKQIQKAISLNPNSAAAHAWYWDLLISQGHLDRAIVEREKAVELDPLSPMYQMVLGMSRYYAGQHAVALEVSERAAALRPDVYLPSRAVEMRVLFALGRKQEAVVIARSIRQSRDLEPRFQADSDAIWILRQAGFEQDAAEYAAELLTTMPTDSYRRGFVLGALGRIDEALPILERTPPLSGIRWLYYDTLWDEWRGDPRFTQLMVKLGRADQYNTARATLARMQNDTPARK